MLELKIIDVKRIKEWSVKISLFRGWKGGPTLSLLFYVKILVKNLKSAFGPHDVYQLVANKSCWGVLDVDLNFSLFVQLLKFYTAN